MAKPAALGRRRGTTRRSGSTSGSTRTIVLIVLVGLLVLAALLLGMLLGTHVLSNNPRVQTIRGAAVAGVHQLMRQKTMDEMDQLELARQQQQNQKLKQQDANAKTSEAVDLHASNHIPGVHPSDDDKEPIDANDDKPSVVNAKTNLRVHHNTGGSTKPYPYSLDPVPSSGVDFKSWTAKGGGRFSEYASGDSPYLVSDEQQQASDNQARSRRAYVKAAMQFAWNGYVKYAWGHDEVLPQAKTSNDNWGNMGTTLVDSLDTLWLMGMKDEFYKARDWVRDHLTFNYAHSVSVFETTIRSLGGLLAAYDWSRDEAFLVKAQDLGKRLFHAFDNGILPNGSVDLQDGHSSNVGWTGGNVILAEAGTLQIEFRYLAKMTGITDYATKSEHVFQLLHDVMPKNGLYPNFVRNRQTPLTFANNKITFGAMADSLYEYMLKIWLQGGRTEPLYREMYDVSIQGMHDELLQKSTPSGLWYIADKNNNVLDHKMDHLVCFMGGLLALGAYTDPLGLDSTRAQRDLKTAKALTYTCYQMYARMKTGISPEWIQFHEGQDFEIGRGSPHYLLRPEAFESFYILNYLTGDPVYREWGWECFSAIERYCKTDIAYGQLRDVSQPDLEAQNKMETFFLAETLKYLYLLQDPDSEVDILNKHVFNTEAHPMRIFPVIDKETNKK